MKRCFLVALLLGLALSAVSARDLLQEPENNTNGSYAGVVSYCSSVGAANKDACCAGSLDAGTYDGYCPGPGPNAPSQCATQANPAACCADKAAARQYDPGCPLGNPGGSGPGDTCATWPPAHRRWCCDTKVLSNLGDPTCYALKTCSDWTNPALSTACCAHNTAATIRDASCPKISTECVTYAPGLDLDKCCKDKLAFNKYDPACPITSACSTHPPQHRYTCCKAVGSADAACADPALEAKPCNQWLPGDLPYCCAVKAAKGVTDPNCGTGTATPKPPIPTPTTPTACEYPCLDSCFISLPKVTDSSNKKYLLGYNPATAKAAADSFCLKNGYGNAGTYDSFTLLPLFFAGASAWATYDPVSMTPCSGTSCAVIGVVECVKPGATPLPKDAAGNVGCENTGSNIIGVRNQGSNVRGSGNSGSDVWGDSNTGSGVIGSGNSGSNVIGNKNGPFTL